MPIVHTASEHSRPVNGSYFARVNPADGKCLLEKYSQKHHDFGCALLANLFASEGKPGKVIIPITTQFFVLSAKNLSFYCPQYNSAQKVRYVNAKTFI